MRQRYDVAVIGAGLAGLQCARLLARRGVSVLLVDRKADPGDGVHTTGIFVRRTLEDFRLPEDCLGPAVRDVRLFSPARRALALVGSGDEFRVGRMAALYRRYLAQCLRLGVHWLPRTRYIGSIPGPDGSLLWLQMAGRSWVVPVGYVVAADGAVSRVAADLGLDQNREWVVGVEEVLTGVPLAGPPRFDCYLDPMLAPGYLAWVVHDGEAVHVGVGGYAQRFDPNRALAAFRQSLDLRGGDVVERRGGRIPVGGVLRRLANGRGLLVGDASGAPSPLTAGGLDPCLRLSTLAAQIIPEFLEHRAPAALAPYDGTRFRPRFISRLGMRRVLSVLGPASLETACWLLRQPPLRPLAWHVFFGRGSFPLEVAVPLPDLP